MWLAKAVEAMMLFIYVVVLPEYASPMLTNRLPEPLLVSS